MTVAPEGIMHVFLKKARSERFSPLSFEYFWIHNHPGRRYGITLGYREFGVENTEPLLMLVCFDETMETWLRSSSLSVKRFKPANNIASSL